MARVLIVGCGCRGRLLAARLTASGYQVRGTTRDPGAVAALEAAGVEAIVADPLRLATLMQPIDGVSAACWLMGSARGDPEDVAALHRTRLESMLELLIDTHVRGFVYEGAGAVEPTLLEHGRTLVERSGVRGMQTACVRADPRDPAWLDAAADAVGAVHGDV